MKRTSTLCGLVAMIGLVLVAGRAGADPIVVDSFDGVDGTALATYDGDYSAVAPIPTSVNKKAEIDSPGLQLAGKYSAGNSLYMSLPDGTGTYQFRNDADLADFTAYAGDTVFMSAFFKAGEADLGAANDKLYVVLPMRKASGTIHEQFMGLRRQTDAEGGNLAIYTLSEGDYSGSNNNLGLYTADTVVQIVMKIAITEGGANDAAHTYFALNPSVGVEPTWTEAGEWSSSTDFDFYEFMVAVNKPTTLSGAVAQGWIDEIRIGRSYSDVVVAPEPGTLMLLGTGLLGGLGYLRRRRSS